MTVDISVRTSAGLMHYNISIKIRKNIKIKYNHIKLICSLASIKNFSASVSVKVCILRSKELYRTQENDTRGLSNDWNLQSRRI